MRRHHHYWPVRQCCGKIEKMKDATTPWIGISNQIPQFKASSRPDALLDNKREKDFRIRADHRLAMSQQIDSAVKKTNIICAASIKALLKFHSILYWSDFQEEWSSLHPPK